MGWGASEFIPKPEAPRTRGRPVGLSPVPAGLFRVGESLLLQGGDSLIDVPEVIGRRRSGRDANVRADRGVNLGPAAERLIHRAMTGDIEQTPPLLRAEIAFEDDGALERRAGVLIARVMGYADLNPIERQPHAVRVQAQGHRGRGSERRSQQLIGIQALGREISARPRNHQRRAADSTQQLQLLHPRLGDEHAFPGYRCIECIDGHDVIPR